jgi:Flp pilus assembly protein CpaB
MVREVSIPVDTVPRDSIDAMTKVINKFAKERVRPGQPILSPQIAETGKPGEERPQGLPGVAPAAPASGAPPPKTVDAAFVVDKGKVMVAVDYPEAAKLVTAGVLRPGDKVDIYIKAPGINSDQIALIFSNIEIKAIGRLATAGGEAPPSPTLIFIVPPQDALVLKYLEGLGPFLLLRAAGDVETIRTDLVTMDYLVQRFRLQRAGGGR